MADNLGWTSGSGNTIATDDVAGVHYQKLKLVDGTADSTNAAVVNASGNLTVKVNEALPTGSNVIGAVTQSGTWAVTDGGGSITVDGTFWQATQPVSGTFWQATQPVSLASLPALAAGSALVGKVGIDQTTVGTTNAVSLAQIGANTVSTGNGTAGTGCQRVTIASDNTAFSVNAVQSGTWNIADGGGSITVDGTFWQATQPVSGTFWQATQPVSLASLPSLAAGTAYAGKVRLTDGTNDTSVIATIGSLKTDLSSVAGTATSTGNGVVGAGVQRVAIASDNTAFSVNAVQSGTWNIGTITTLPALVAGSAIIGNVRIDQTTPGTTNATSLSHVGSTAVATGNGVVGTGVQRVAIASDNTAFSVNAVQSGTWNIGTITTLPALVAGSAIIGNVRIDQTTVGTTNAVSLAQIGATTVATGNGVVGTGVQRVAIASDNTAFSVNATLAAGTAYAGKVRLTDGTNDTSVIATIGSLKSDLSSVAGTATSTGNGTAGTGCQRVTIASDNTAFTVNATATGNVAHDGADSGNPVKIGGVARTTNPTAVANGDRVDAFFDDLGKQVVILNCPHDLTGVQQTTITSSTSETTIVTAGASGVFRHITHLSITNSSSTATLVTLKDSTTGTTRGIWSIAANGGIVLPFNIPLGQAAAANNWTLTCGTSVASIYVVAQYANHV